jgi:hypothetical protein
VTGFTVAAAPTSGEAGGGSKILNLKERTHYFIGKAGGTNCLADSRVWVRRSRGKAATVLVLKVVTCHLARASVIGTEPHGSSFPQTLF